MSEQQELKKGSTPILILAVLAEGARHGYAIAREIERRSSDALSVGEGALYPALRALEREGLVQSEWQTQPTDAATRGSRATPSGIPAHRAGSRSPRARAPRHLAHGARGRAAGRACSTHPPRAACSRGLRARPRAPRVTCHRASRVRADRSTRFGSARHRGLPREGGHVRARSRRPHASRARR